MQRGIKLVMFIPVMPCEFHAVVKNLTGNAALVLANKQQLCLAALTRNVAWREEPFPLIDKSDIRTSALCAFLTNVSFTIFI